MNNTLLKNKAYIKTQTLAAFIAVAAAVVLPQMFHFLGKVTGVGALGGETFLPMHLPVILVGFLAGPYAGAVAGFMAPIASFAFSGMPALAVLPFITAEIFTYGLVSGLIKNKNMPVFLKLLTAQAAGRAVRLLFTLCGIYFFSSALTMETVFSSMLKGLPGIVLQWVSVMLIVKAFEKKKAE